MTYSQTLDYLYNTLPMFSRIGSAAFKKDLTNIRALCRHFGNPHEKFRSIHIGGTNGKGSVSHMLAAILQTAGYKTGLYTSPHLFDFRERIKVDGAMVDENFVVDFVESNKLVIEEIQPSFFEITVAMAFQYFAEQEIDVAVVEVGLGGRLDSTNIITPELAVITNISWDHMNMLGNSLEQIAFEKAGIIKENIPIIIGERDKVTATVFEKTAMQKKAPLVFASDQFSVRDFKVEPDVLHITVQEMYGVLKKFALDLSGIYQTKNILTVLQAVATANEHGFAISETALQYGLRNTKKLTGLHGRWEVIHRRPTIVLEVAHNEAGIQQLREHLKQITYENLHFVIGFVKDKDITNLLQLLPTDAAYYFTQAHIPRALDAASLQQKAAMFHLQGEAYEDVDTALQAALKKANTEDLIIVCGSIFLVAEVSTVKQTVSK